VINLAGGYAAWARAGLPVVRQHAPALTPSEGVAEPALGASRLR